MSDLVRHQKTDFLTRRLICHFIFQSKESDAARLAEELGASKAREHELDARLKNEMQRLAEQMEDFEDRRKAEVDN